MTVVSPTLQSPHPHSPPPIWERGTSRWAPQRPVSFPSSPISLAAASPSARRKDGIGGEQGRLAWLTASRTARLAVSPTEEPKCALNEPNPTIISPPLCGRQPTVHSLLEGASWVGKQPRCYLAPHRTRLFLPIYVPQVYFAEFARAVLQQHRHDLGIPPVVRRLRFLLQRLPINPLPFVAFQPLLLYRMHLFGVSGIHMMVLTIDGDRAF